MSYIRHIATSRAGPDTHVTGITDLAVAQTDAGLRVYSASGRDGGVLVRDAELAVTDQAAFRATVGLGAEAQIELTSLGGRDALLITGPAQAGLTGFWLDRDGDLGGRFDLRGPTIEAITAMEVVELGGEAVFFTATRGTTGLTAWREGAQGQLEQVAHTAVALQEEGNDIFALEHVQTAQGNFLMAVSADGNGVHSFALGNDGTPRLVDAFDMTDGLGVNTPTTLSQVMVDGQSYLLVGAAGSSSITVMAVGADGTLRPTDQVNDDLNTRFQSISVLETIELDGRAYVVAGGADDGLSLMTLLPGGRLLHLETIADDLNTALTNPAALDLSVVEGRIVLHAAGNVDDTFGASGVGHFEIDPTAGTSGSELVIGGAGDDALRGTAGADVIVDGAGADRMWGGEGADIFVLSGDGETDTIEDFQIGIDRIDMSQLGRFYSIDAVEISSRGNGAQIRLGNEIIEIQTPDRASLSAEDFTTSDLIGLWHVATAALPKGNQQIDGSVGNDQILGAEGADTITGGQGADTIVGVAGDDVIFGGTWDASFDPAAGMIFRLYQATLDRAPDATGHRGWVDILSRGEQSLVDVASGFVRSAEFRQEYGDVSDTEFVTLLYNNVLGRAPDAGGLQGWAGAMEDGASRAEVVVGFSQSREFQISTTAGSMRLSMEGYRNDWLDDVYRLYEATLDRAPDIGGLEGWTTALADGVSIAQAAEGFSGSREFQNTYGALDDAGFVSQLYLNVLGRAADAGGLQGWTAVLENGASRGEVVAGFSQSREFRIGTEADMKQWVRAQGTDDVLEGGAGSNVLMGGMWSDCFVFDIADGGQHTIADFENWDMLQFEGFGYEDAGDVRAHLVQDGNDVVFKDQGVEVRLIETDLEMLNSDDLFDI